MLNIPHRSDAASRATALPRSSVPHSDQALWEATEAEHRLAVELEKVLGRLPQPNIDAIRRDMHSPAIADVIQTATDAEREDFEWQSGDGGSDDEDVASDNAVATITAWLGKAKRERRQRRLRHAAAWFSTLAIGAIIVGAAAYLLVGWRPDVGNLLALAQRAWS